MDKEAFLKANHTFNFRNDKVIASRFIESDLYASRDLLQVRYELVRSIEEGDIALDEVPDKYGVSSVTAKRYVRSFKEGGMIALVPEQKGPKGPSSLDDEALRFIDSYIAEHPKASGRKVHEALESERHLGISKRTVERYLSSKKAKGGRRKDATPT